MFWTTTFASCLKFVIMCSTFELREAVICRHLGRSNDFLMVCHMDFIENLPQWACVQIFIVMLMFLQKI